MTRQKKAEQNGTDRTSTVAELAAEVQSKQTKEYILKRIIPQMQWYSRKIQECRKKYYHWMTAIILLSAVIPIASVFADGTLWGKIPIAALGAAVTAGNSFLVLYNYKDLWLTYRNIHEALLRIVYCYFNNAGAFSGNAPQEEKDLLFVNTCEEQLSSETNNSSSAIKK